MFNTLASYLLGNSNNINSNPSTSNGTNENNREVKVEEKAIVTDNNLTTAVCDEDDDWLLVVEKEEEESLPRTDSEEELPFIDIKNSPLTRSERIRHSVPASSSSNHDDNQYKNVQLYCPPAHNSMEESWFVTPPPCFTSTGPVNVETSPLENLLIEHPSMSVYRFVRTSTQVIDEEDMVVLDFSETLENGPADERIPVHTTRVLTRQSERAARTRTERAGPRLTDEQSKQIVLARSGQKSCEKKGRQVLCRGAMERSNKVREVNSNRRQKRSDAYSSRLISRANNNRKC